MREANGVGIGWSGNPNAAVAGQTAARMALKRLASQSADCAIVFGASWFDQGRLLAGVHSVLGAIPTVGGSTAGEILPEGPKSHSCLVLVIAHEEFTASVGVGSGVDTDPRLAGYHMAQRALRNFTGHKRSGLLLFGDGLLTGYAEVLRGVQEVLGTSSLVTGGLMGDDLRFMKTYQYAQEQAVHHSVVGLLLGGSCTMGVGIEHGFSPISKPRCITRAHGNLLQELDGQPTSSVYEEYFGASGMETVQQAGLTRQLIAYPLGMQLETSGQFLLRNIMAFGEDGSLVCTGEVTEGSWVQLMLGSKELALAAATKAAQAAIQPLRTVWFALVFDSVVRRRLLGRDATLEIEAIRQALGPSVPFIGCYTYGEQAPLGSPLYAYGRASVQSGSCLIVAVGT